MRKAIAHWIENVDLWQIFYVLMVLWMGMWLIDHTTASAIVTALTVGVIWLYGWGMRARRDRNAVRKMAQTVDVLAKINEGMASELQSHGVKVKTLSEWMAAEPVKEQPETKKLGFRMPEDKNDGEE